MAKLLLQLASSARGNGFFGDELYDIACAEHPDWGYVEHPPLSIWLLSAWEAVFGDSLASVRTFPALLGAASVVVAGVLARELGARGSGVGAGTAPDRAPGRAREPGRPRLLLDERGRGWRST